MKNGVPAKDKTTNGHIVPQQPSSLSQRFQHEMNKMFDDFSEGFGLFRHDQRNSLSRYEAKIDVKDVDSKIVVTAEIPGVDLVDIEVTATPSYVSIAGEKHAQKEEKEKGYYRMEREYGYFRRVLPMPCEIDRDQIDATFKNGVLTLTLPKTEAAIEQECKVPVKEG